METLPKPRTTTILPPPPTAVDVWANGSQMHTHDDDFGGFDPEQWISDAHPTDVDDLRSVW